MHIFNAGGSARWGPVPFMKKEAERHVGRAVGKNSDGPLAS